MSRSGSQGDQEDSGGGGEDSRRQASDSSVISLRLRGEDTWGFGEQWRDPILL